MATCLIPVRVVAVVLVGDVIVVGDVCVVMAVVVDSVVVAHAASLISKLTRDTEHF